MRCIAVDDETPALYLLEDNIKRLPFLELVKCCKNGFEAIDVLQKERIDLMYLDIEMPGINGLEFLQSLSVRPLVIFTTAYRKYALDGYELNVIDYLLKPIAFDRFLSASTKALEYYNLKLKRNPAEETSRDSFFVNAEYCLIKIVISEIQYIESLKDYIKIYLANEPKPVITRLSMKLMEEKLPYHKFVRIHKSYIVPVDGISSIRKDKVNLGIKELPISDHYRENIFKIIDQRKIQ